MVANYHIWRIWARGLQRWGVHTLAAELLEAAGPLNTIGAQAVFLSQPLLNSLLPSLHVQAFADMLEEPAQSRAFAALLREEMVG